MASTYLQKTFSSAGNRKKWTWSGWVKRSSTDSTDSLFGCAGSTNQVNINIESSTNAVDFWVYSSGAYAGRKTTNRKLRDCNGFYHIVVSYDSANATADDRMKIYINGERQTSFSTSTNPSQNLDGELNNNVVHQIGANGNNNNDFNGIMSHVHFIDGTAYDADTFGETDATTGIWKPKTAPSVTYGTNGFFLKFENSGAFGTDSSGNGNNFTVNGTMTQTIDTPSNVFTTWNPLINFSSYGTLSKGNLTYTAPATGWVSAVSTLGFSSGKYYYEYKIETPGSSGNYHQLGFVSEQLNYSTGDIAGYTSTVDGAYAFYCVGSSLEVKKDNAVISGYDSGTLGVSFSTGDIMCLAIDMDNKKVYFRKNNDAWIKSADPVAGTNGLDISSDYPTGKILLPAVSVYNATGGSANFGNGFFGTTAVSSAENPDDGIGIFEYAVPTGYKALCTKSINAQEYD
jgi:hypothetical protein